MLLYSFSENVLDSLHCSVVCNVNSVSKLRTEILKIGPIKSLHFRLYVPGITTLVTLETFLVKSARSESLKQFDYYIFIYL